ncbi:type III secretion system export apparatus subunit SctS [Luteimonas salinilitoris]|uniref:Type III secretion system export apparatus subunit SctS n=1 Tax=Luteimonas salinilitoris TaxID=3237697 RepID=A0ABV4HVF5_9GAMM
MNEVLELTRQALWLVLLLSGPPIAAAALVGLVVAFLQAATQLQEQTFAYALKFLAIVLMLFVTGSLIGGTLYTYANQIFLDFPGLVRGGRVL